MTEAGHVIFVPFMTAFGGVERLVITLSRYLRDAGLSHTVVTFSNSANIARRAGWPVPVVELKGSRNSILEMRRLRRWMKRQAPARANRPVLAFDLKGAFYARGADVRYALHLTDPPSLLSEDISKHAPSFGGSSSRLPLPLRLRAELAHRLTSAGVRKASTVIVMTDRIAGELADLYGVSPSVIRPGIEHTGGAVSGQSDARLRFLTVGRLADTKRVDWILEALSSLERSVWHGAVEWQLVIIGEGPERENLEVMADRLGVSANVLWMGAVPDGALAEAYRDATVFLMPAAQGWGLPALEALSHGTPVVMHGGSGVAEILDDSPWVEITDGDSFETFSSAIRKMLDRLKTLEAGNIPLPRIPCSDDWAAQVCEATGWKQIPALQNA